MKKEEENEKGKRQCVREEKRQKKKGRKYAMQVKLPYNSGPVYAKCSGSSEGRKKVSGGKEGAERERKEEEENSSLYI